jgi:hypothetical protein
MTMVQILSAKSGILVHSDLLRFLGQRVQQLVALFRYGVQSLPRLLSSQRVAREMVEIAACAAISLR